MLDVDPGRRPVEIGEPDLDLGRVGSGPPGGATSRPDDAAAPRRRSDPSRARCRRTSARRSVRRPGVRRSPRARARSRPCGWSATRVDVPAVQMVECPVGRAGDLEGQVERFDHRRSVFEVLSATSRNRAPASPQTSVEVASDGLDPLVVEPVDPTGAARLLDDESSPLQEPEMAGHGRPADRERLRELANRSIAGPQQLDDRPPVRVPERIERVARQWILWHRPMVTGW